MSKKVLQTLSYLFFLFLGVYLIYVTFGNQDLGKILVKLKEVNYYWYLPVFVVSLISFYCRSERWRLLIKLNGYESKPQSTFFSLMFGYLVNLSLPRIGEFTRCFSLGKLEKTPFTVSFAAVLVERFIDVLILFSLVALAFYIEYDHLHVFFSEQIFTPLIEWYKNKKAGNSKIWIYAIGGVGVVLYFIYQKYKDKIDSKLPIEKVDQTMNSFSDGLKSILLLRGKNLYLFIFYTIMIWTSTFLMTYFWFFSLEATSQLGIKEGLVLLVLGSMGKSVPIHGGGMGAYHYLVTKGFLIYGVSEVFGGTLSIIIHGAQMFHNIVFGLIALLYILWFGKKVD